MDLATAFHFTVIIDGLKPEAGPDCGFREVAGIGAELELETVHEGGENRYALQLPKAARGGRLTLKRGMLARSSPLAQWCVATLQGGLTQRIKTRLLHVHLLDAERR